jgi:hypothetical protein
MAYTAEQLTKAIERAKAANNEAAVEELSALLARTQPSAPAPMAAPAQAQMPEQAVSFQPPASAFSAARPDVAGAQFQPPEGLRQFLYSSLETVPPALASMRLAASTTPQGMAYNVLATGLTAGLAQLSSIGLKGGDVTSPESLGKAAKASIEFGPPGPILGGRAFLGLQGGFSKAAQSGILAGTAAATGAGAEQMVSGKNITPEKNWENAVLPSLTSASLFGLGQAGGRLYEFGSQIAARRSFFQSLGIKNPTLAAIMPERFGVVESAGQYTDPALAAQRAQMEEDASSMVMGKFQNGNFASNEQVANLINPQIAAIRDADNFVKAANATYEQANAAYLAAQANTQLNPVQKATVLQDAKEQVYRAVQDQASAILNRRKINPVEMSGQAEEVSGVLQNLMTLRSNVAKDKYAPLRSIGAVFSVDEIEDAARKGMGAYADTEQGKVILKGIRGYTGDGVQVSPERVNPEAAFDPTAPITLPSETRFDLEAVRQMRAGISEIIDAQEAGFQGRMEREASKAYAAINDRVRDRLEGLGTKTLAQQWDAARDYWASTFRAMESDDRVLRMLVKGKATTDDIGLIASKLVGADAGTIKALNGFVDVVSQSDPVQRDLTLSAIGSAVSNHLMFKHTLADGGTNWNGLFDEVLRYSGVQGVERIFPVAKLGLGTRQQIQQNRAVVRDFKDRGLTDTAITEAFNSPLFQEAVAAGSSGTKALTRSLAEAEFRQRVLTAQGLIAAGLTAKANAEFSKANQALQVAGLSKGQAQQRVQELQLDPAYQVLSGQIELSKAPEVTAGRIGDLLLKTDEPTARMWVNHLKKTDPNAFDVIATNTLGNFLESNLKSAGAVTRAGFEGDPRVVDFTKLRTQFSIRNSDYAKLRAILPDETMARLDAMPAVVRLMDDALNSRPVSDSSLRRMAQILGLGLGFVQDIPAGKIPIERFGNRRWFEKFGDIVANNSYNLVAKQLLNPESNIVGFGGSYADFVSRLPTQQATILLFDKKLADQMARQDERDRAKQGQPTR